MTALRVAVIGGGVIGGGWAARLAANGISAAVYDPDPDAPRRTGEILQNAEHAMAKLTAAPRPPFAAPRFAGSLAEAARDADLVIEAAPEREDVKKKIFAELEDCAPPSAIVASSTSGIRPSILQQGMRRPERLLVAHPFNPVYLLPLVELVGGEQTAPATIKKTAKWLEELGMRPLIVKKEIDAFIADRLMEALWREALWLVHDGVATASDVDDAMRFGFGLRWAQMGLFETFRIAGGEGGMRHFLKQFGPCLKWPWSRLSEVPDLDDALAEKIAAQSDAHSEGRSPRELERIRDDNLAGFLQILKANSWGAGQTLAAWERRQAAAASQSGEIGAPFRAVSRRIPPHWADYNGHMNESRYLECCSDASAALLDRLGAGEEYAARGDGSFFTVQTRLRHLREMRAGDMVHADVQIVSAEGKKLEIFCRISGEDGEPAAEVAQLLIHVSMQTRRSAPPPDDIGRRMQTAAAAHAGLPPPSFGI